MIGRNSLPVALLLSCCAIGADIVLAQSPGAGPPAGGPFAATPLPADAPKPSPEARDLRGYYFMRSFGILLPGIDQANPPFTPAALALFRKRIADRKAGLLPDDPQVQCRPMNAVRFFGSGFPEMQFLQSPNEVALLLMEDHIVRRIAINAKHPAHPALTSHGDSIGHWEDDTLVVDTIGFKDNGWLDETGTPGDHNEHLIERIKKVDGGQKIEDQVTIEDGTVLTHPLSFTMNFAWRPDAPWDEIICEEGNRDGGDTPAASDSGTVR